jgi:hypothetical protein
MENTPAKTSPKDFFLYAFAAGALYFCAVTLVTLLWQLINFWLPLPESLYYFGSEGISGALRWSIALLVIIFPAYVASMWWIGKDVDREPAKQHIWVRRWFIYATLFFAAVTLLGDLVFLVYTLLGGDVAARFILKALSVAVVAAGVFAYHWFLLKREPGTAMQARKVITVVASLAVAAAVVAGFAVAGSPSSARAERNDATRISNLQDIQWQTTNFWQQKERLPASLDELVDPANPVPLPVDPVSGEPYRLEVVDTYSFRLCATFETDYSEPSMDRSTVYPMDVVSGKGGPITWAHGVGETCFDRTIDPERYPQINL